MELVVVAIARRGGFLAPHMQKRKMVGGTNSIEVKLEFTQ
jgi:hypothetical protein